MADANLSNQDSVPDEPVTRAFEHPLPPVTLPEPFGPYHIVRLLGQGGMGAVYLARDTRLDRLVALKVPHFAPEDGIAAGERFQRSARAAARLTHPNLCPIHEVGEVQGIPYLTMPYLEMPSLQSRLHEGLSPTPQQAAALVHRLAVALQAAHQAGIVHRDLNPGNILLNPDGEPIIVDFGLARQLETDAARLTQTGQVLGTPGYIAPEQLSGVPEAQSASCDIFSMGVVLYELLTDQLPFGRTLHEVLHLMTRDPVPPSAQVPGIDPVLDHICAKALARKVEERHASMSELAEALLDYLRKQKEPIEQIMAGFNPAVPEAILFEDGSAAESIPVADLVTARQIREVKEPQEKSSGEMISANSDPARQPNELKVPSAITAEKPATLPRNDGELPAPVGETRPLENQPPVQKKELFLVVIGAGIGWALAVSLKGFAAAEAGFGAVEADAEFDSAFFLGALRGSIFAALGGFLGLLIGKLLGPSARTPKEENTARTGSSIVVMGIAYFASIWSFAVGWALLGSMVVIMAILLVLEATSRRTIDAQDKRRERLIPQAEDITTLPTKIGAQGKRRDGLISLFLANLMAPDRCAWLALLVPFVVMGIVLYGNIQSFAMGLVLGGGMVIVVAILLVLDAVSLGMIDTQGKRREEPLHLFFAILILWIAVYPLAFSRRRHFRRPNLGLLALLIVGLCAALTFFPDQLAGIVGSGRKVRLGDIVVFYYSPSTRNEAEQIGNYLSPTWWGRNGRRTIELTKSAAGYQVRMVVPTTGFPIKELRWVTANGSVLVMDNDWRLDGEGILKFMQVEGFRISRDVFEGTCVEVHACDELGKTIRVLPSTDVQVKNLLMGGEYWAYKVDRWELEYSGK